MTFVVENSILKLFGFYPKPKKAFILFRSRMMKNYKYKVGSLKGRYSDETQSSLEGALETLHEGMSVLDAAKEFKHFKNNIPGED